MAPNRCFTSKNGAQGLHKTTWRPFLEVTPKRRLHDLCERKCVGKSCTNTFWASLGRFEQNPSHPKTSSAPAPMMKRNLRTHCPSFERAEGKMPSILRHPCAYSSTHTLFTRCCRLQCVTVMNISQQRSPKTEQFITAKISGNALKQGSRTRSVLRHRNSHCKNTTLHECLTE